MKFWSLSVYTMLGMINHRLGQGRGWGRCKERGQKKRWGMELKGSQTKMTSLGSLGKEGSVCTKQSIFNISTALRRPG